MLKPIILKLNDNYLKSVDWSRKTRNDEIWVRGIEGLGI